jgi:hypothetical protein
MYKKNNNYLFEQDSKPRGAPEKDVNVSGDFKARKSKHSLDDQIDALILRYEVSSIVEKDDVDGLMESLSRGSLKFLFEQDEEAAEEVEEETGSEPSGSETMTVSKPAEQIVPNLDIDAFAARSVRLINNPAALLDLKTVILNRVKNFLDENYGDEFVTRYLEVLENEFGIEIDEFDPQAMQKTSNDVFAVGANPTGAGMSG